MQKAVAELTKELHSLGFMIEPRKKTYMVMGPGGDYWTSFPKSVSPYIAKQLVEKARKHVGKGETPTAQRPTPAKVATPPPPRTTPVAHPPTPSKSMAASVPSTRQMTVDPALAEEWLRTMNVNRPLRNERVEAYARDMASGDWRVTGDSVKFDRDGHLIDGQHRCWACIEAGCEFTTTVAVGIDPEAFAVLDSGLPRSAADMLTLSGETGAKALASVAKMILLHKAGGWKAVLSVSGRYRPTNTEVQTILADVGERVKVSMSYGRKCGHLLSAPLAGFMHYMFSHRSQEESNAFFAWLATGEGLMKSSPIYALRERLIRMKKSKQYTIRREVGILVIRAWNAAREGRSMTKITRATPMDESAAIPEIV